MSQLEGERLFTEAAGAIAWAVVYRPSAASAAATASFETFSLTFGSFWKWVSAGASPLPSSYCSALLQVSSLTQRIHSERSAVAPFPTRKTHNIHQKLGLVLHDIVDGLGQQPQGEPAVPVAGFAAMDIRDSDGSASASTSASADASAPADCSSTASDAPATISSSCPNFAAANIVSLLQSFHESMTPATDGVTCCADFISTFVFACMSHIDWSSLQSSSVSCPGRLAVIAASQPLLQVMHRDCLSPNCLHMT